MPRLNQIIAVVNGRKTRSQKQLTEIYRKLEKPALFEGLSRTYQPVDEDGETQPPEKKNVQYNTRDAIAEARATLVDLLNLTATQDWANCEAQADVTVDNQVILAGVPVTHLLFLDLPPRTVPVSTIESGSIDLLV